MVDVVLVCWWMESTTGAVERAEGSSSKGVLLRHPASVHFLTRSSLFRPFLRVSTHACVMCVCVCACDMALLTLSFSLGVGTMEKLT